MLNEEWKDPINITKEQWMIILEDRDIIKEKDVQLLKLLYGCSGCKATATQLAQLLNMPSHAPINSQVGLLGKRIVKNSIFWLLSRGMAMDLTGGTFLLGDRQKRKDFIGF